MSKDKKKSKEGETTDSSSTIPENKPQESNMAPEVQDTKGPSHGVLDTRLVMEKVDSPRYGVPGQATATRASAGGGAYNPSTQVGRTPSNRIERGAGSDPLNKMDLRDEASWNEIGAQQFRTLIKGAPAGFSNDKFLGNFTYEDNLVFQFDNVGYGPGCLNDPYRRRVQSVSKDQCIFTAGQHVTVGSGGRPLQFYPTHTYSRTEPNRTVVNVSGLNRGNYLMRGMRVTVHSGALYSIGFDTEAITVNIDPRDLDVIQDNSRVFWDIADRDITETYFDLVNKQENLAANKFSPLPDGQPDAMQHLMLSRDITATDGIIAMLAARSSMEAYAYHRMMRSEYGSGQGSQAQARNLLCARTPAQYLWHDDVNMTGSRNVAYHDNNVFYLDAPSYIMDYLDSPSKYNNSLGVWFTLPRGIRMLYEEMQKSFDSCGFMVDKDTYTIINKMFGWHKHDNVMAGINRFGLIVPVDYNQIYEQTNGTIFCDATTGEVHSRLTYCDYVLNGSFYNKTEVRSPLVDAILSVFKYRIIPKLMASRDYEFYIPFDFASDHLSFGNMVLMEAFTYMHPHLHAARAIFERFEQMYGVNPLKSDLMQDLKLADVMAGSCYKGLGADPVLNEMDAATELFMALPETYQLSARTWDNGLTDWPNCQAMITFNNFAPTSDSIDDPQTMLFPMFYETEHLKQWQTLFDLGPEKVHCTRDMPIHRYHLNATNFTRDDSLGRMGIDNTTTPFFGLQMPEVYYSANTSGCHLDISIRDILSAPRISGRIAPAPMGMLDFCYCGHGSAAADITEHLLLGRERNEDDEWVDTYLNYRWGATLDTLIITFDPYEHGVPSQRDIIVNGSDIDNYRVDMIFMPEFSTTMLGSLLMRYMVHFESGVLSQAELTQLQEDYGMWLRMDTPNYIVPQVTAVAFDSTDHGTELVYLNSCLLNWTTDNVFPFITSPFTGNIDATLDENDGQYVDIDSNPTLALSFGLAGYQTVYYERHNLDIYGMKQAAGGRIYDNSILHQSNLLFE